MSYVTRKTALKNILKDEYRLPIQDAVTRTGRIIFHAYNFLTLCLLSLAERDEEIPVVDRQFILTVMRTVSMTPFNTGTGVVDIRYPILKEFFDVHYKSLLQGESPPSRAYLSQIITLEAEQMETAIANNIRSQYLNRLREFVNDNLRLKKIHRDIDEMIHIPKAERSLRKRNISILARQIKEDILTGTSTAPPEYQLGIQMERFRLIPQLEVSVFYDLKASPLKFLPGLLYLHQQLRGKFRALPLRTSHIQGYITLDREGLWNIFCNRTEFSKNHIWDVFDFDQKILKGKRGERFHFIKTDGVGASVVFASSRHNPMDTPEPKDEPYVQPLRLGNRKIVAIDPNKEDLLFCVDGLKSSDDPSPKTGVLRYTKAQRNKETKKRRFQRFRVAAQKEKLLIATPKGPQITSVKKLESSLSQTPHKTASTVGFHEYLAKKLEISKTVRKHYEEHQVNYRQLRWITYIETQKSEAKWLRKFKWKYGGPSQVVVCFGDYDQRNMKNLEPVKGKSFRNLFRKRGYQVLLVDEHRTSCTCSACHGSLQTFKIRESPRPWRNGQSTLVHGLLRCPTCNGRERLWNRDLNAARNIWAIAYYEIFGYGRPPWLSRSATIRDTSTRVNRIRVG